jgi:hypothetical protein
MSVLAERLRAIHAALDDAGLPHAFGGAIALAYCTEEPRGTRDLDVNVFVDPSRADEVFEAMPPGVEASKADRRAARRDGQVRLWWEQTPIDLFFDMHEFHHEAAREIRTVDFENETIPVLGCEALVVFKVLFNRTRDWADVEAILEVGSIDGRRVLGHLLGLLDADDPKVARLRDLVFSGSGDS